MLDHNAVHLAVRARALTLAVVTTGSTSLSATATGYARATGSFVTDGFATGMEITPTAFAANTVDVLIGVTATTLTTRNARAVEAAAGSRTIAVLFPAQRAFENVEITPVSGQPYIEEQYLPGPASLDAFGSQGDMSAEPMYVLNVYTPSNVGITASNKYTDALLALFKPSTEITAGSNTVFVRANPAPYKGQRTNTVSGLAAVTVTIPLVCYTNNA